MIQETTQHTGYRDIPIVGSARAESAQADFSIDDYGRVGDQRPYQVIQPAYNAPKFLKQFEYLGHALRECSTLCHLEGKPFRVVRWGRTGSGNKGGINECKICRAPRPMSRFPGHVPPGSGNLHGYPDARPIAEFHPDGQKIVFNPQTGAGKLVGRPNYVVSHTPFPRLYKPGAIQQRYLEAVKTAQLLAKRSGRRAYICSGLGADCKGRDPKLWVPVVYVSPGGLDKRYPNIPTGTTIVNPISKAYFRELIAESKGASLLGQGN
jgi:hypothetical protein